MSSRTLTTLALAVAACGASVLSPTAATAPAAESAPDDDECEHMSSHELESALEDAEPGEQVCVKGDRHSRHHRRGTGQDTDDEPDARPRPMTSGERQYRNGCEHGLVVDGCDRFTAKNLIDAGIDPLR
ncbi:hypothetical protein [Pseudonocardia acaciae]|uniref:hypothetical protein n=1 Tax=Pseudonocardia acaciae TaxID=551276 RepID=UPI00048F58E1|nr:hypothetical protein [Pseudonocardia acaciae]